MKSPRRDASALRPAARAFSSSRTGGRQGPAERDGLGRVGDTTHGGLAFAEDWFVSWSESPVLTYRSHLAPSGSVTQVSTLVA
jgi:hypothetical protein